MAMTTEDYMKKLLSGAEQPDWLKTAQAGSQLPDGLTGLSSAAGATGAETGAVPGTDWNSRMADLYNQIQNRKGFSYNPNEDASYKALRQQYYLNGQRAMQDTIGQGAALTGGYNSSYAQSAGQQEFDRYLTEFAGQVPGLMQQARAAYDAEGDRLLNLYGLAAEGANREYQQGRDALADQRYEEELAYNRAQSERSEAREYAMYLLQMGITPSAEELAAAGMTSSEASQIANYYKSMMYGGGSGGGGSSRGRSSGGGGGNGSGSGGDGGNGIDSGAVSIPTAAMTGLLSGVSTAVNPAVQTPQISDKARSDLLTYARKNGPEALVAYMKANYNGAGNYYDVLKWIQSTLKNEQNSMAQGSGKVWADMTK